MNIEIGPQKMFNYKIYVCPLLLILFIFSICLIINAQPEDRALIPMLCAITFAVCIFSVILMLIFEVIYVPNGVIIDNDSNQLTFKYQFHTPKTLDINTINAYKDVRIRSKNGMMRGIVIYLPTEKPVLLSDVNLNNYVPVKQFLDNLNVANIGEGNFNFLMYFIHQY